MIRGVIFGVHLCTYILWEENFLREIYCHKIKSLRKIIEVIEVIQDNKGENPVSLTVILQDSHRIIWDNL